MTEEQAERQLNQLVSEIQTLEAYYNDIVSRIQAASAGLSDFRAAIQAVDVLMQSPKNDLLIPIGGGLLLPVSDVEGKRLILSVGAGVAIEKISIPQRCSCRQERKNLSAPQLLWNNSDEK